MLLTNMVGEHTFITVSEFEELATKTLRDDVALRRLRAKHVIRYREDRLPLELLAMKVRTRSRGLAEFTGLHIFVVTLRCDHSCRYCQVSRKNSDKSVFDMSRETAKRAVEATFKSPSKYIKIEFQGGEPLLNFPLVQFIITEARHINEEERRELSFVICSNLALLDDEILRACSAPDIYFSTSLDGPPDLHNENRPRRGGDSWQKAIDGLRRVREELGAERVSALMTTTAASLSRAREIIDTYLDAGLREIFLRPISPYGFALKTKSYSAYDVERWLAFYEEALDYILELNQHGVDFVERYAAIVLKKMLTNDDPGYVGLSSPAGIGIGVLVYNYDGDVYSFDEGRMLAEMGDTTFRLGNLHRDSYAEIMLSEALLTPLEESFALSSPMCTDCAFESYCGSDPVYHHAVAGNFVGRKPESEFCRRNTRIFEMLLEKYESDAAVREVFLDWAAR